MRETIQIRIETLRNYARPGRLTCPLVGIPLVEVGRTIVVRRELLQAALSAPGMERAWVNGDGRLHVEGARARYVIFHSAPGGLLPQQDGPIKGTHIGVDFMVHKWAASQRQRIGKLIRTKGMSAEQKARIKAKQAVEDAKWKLEREFGRHRNRADVARYGYTYRRPEPPRSPVLLAKREVDMEYLSYCRNRAEEWYRTKPIRQALGQLVGRLYAGEFGVLKGWALPVAFYRAADAALGRRAVRESELPARYGSRVERRNSYLRGFWNWGANLPGKPAATLEPASFDREAAELFLKKRREWAERAAWYDALVLELQIAEEQLALLQNQGR